MCLVLGMHRGRDECELKKGCCMLDVKDRRGGGASEVADVGRAIFGMNIICSISLNGREASVLGNLIS